MKVFQYTIEKDNSNLYEEVIINQRKNKILNIQKNVNVSVKKILKNNNKDRKDNNNLDMIICLKNNGKE